MIAQTSFTVPIDLIKEAKRSIPHIDSKLALNKPTGRFFYDPWQIKDEFKDTVWEKILMTLPVPVGEARIIELKDGTCYTSHSDIDDRYHLNIDGQYSFLIDIDSQKMFPTTADGIWYLMNTEPRHVAANFGSISRFQLVIRNLLNDTKLKKPVTVEIRPTCVKPRFEFDDIISPWLNRMNKLSLMTEFSVMQDGVSFKLEHSCIEELEMFPKDKFKISIEQ